MVGHVCLEHPKQQGAHPSPANLSKYINRLCTSVVVPQKGTTSWLHQVGPSVTSSESKHVNLKVRYSNCATECKWQELY